MPKYIISVDREKIHSTEDTLREYYENIYVGVVEAKDKATAKKLAQQAHPKHPEREYFQAIVFNRNSDTLKKIAIQRCK